MAITWITPAGDLGTYTERSVASIPALSATSDVGDITYSVIAGSLPRGLRLAGNIIKGSPTEVRKLTESRFVIRASDGVSLEDRTFKISVDGADAPTWTTPEGYLKVGLGNSYFVLDNSYVNLQLEAYDTDVIAGDVLQYYLQPMGGTLPPGLSLSRDGVISGYTDPIFAVDYNASLNGGYDTGSFDITPIDFVEFKSNGFDDYYYDTQTYDYSESSRSPKRLSRSYNFVIAVTDGANSISRSFKIYVVTEEFLQADNSIVQVGTNVFTADSSSDRLPLWITDSNLGRYRANNYITLFLDVYDPPSLEGTITYFLLPNNYGTYQLNSTGEITTVGQYELSGIYPSFSASNITATNPSQWTVIIPERIGTVPPGLVIDNITGELAGRVPYQSRVSKEYSFTVEAVNFPATLYNLNYNLTGNWNASYSYAESDAVRYLGNIYIAITSNRNINPTDTAYWYVGVSSAPKLFNIEIVGEIESAIEWVSDSNLGILKPNQPSRLFVEAATFVEGGRVNYKFISGSLPQGLEFVADGKLEGKVKQFADSTSNGLTRFYDVENSARVFNTLWDGAATTFDRQFSFVVEARDSLEYSTVRKTFYFTVVSDNNNTFANLYLKAFQSKEKRLAWSNFITDSTIFNPNEIYRYGDVNFGVQTDLKMLVYAGIESTLAQSYIQAMSRNHYRKQILFGDIKVSKAKDPITQQTIYEVIYITIEDDLEKNGKSISRVVNLPDNISSPVLISYDSIKVDSNIPFASDRDHQRVFPNSIKNMRRQIAGIGERDRSFLPLWMRSIQDQATYETGYVKALILCYALPGTSANIVAKIKAKTSYASRGTWTNIDQYQVNDSVIYKGNYWTCIKENTNITPPNDLYWIENFNFRNINFTADRYLIDILDGEIEDKYLAFPQRGEKLP